MRDAKLNRHIQCSPIDARLSAGNDSAHQGGRIAGIAIAVCLTFMHEVSLANRNAATARNRVTGAPWHRPEKCTTYRKTRSMPDGKETWGGDRSGISFSP